jgi:hypothetical protein
VPDPGWPEGDTTLSDLAIAALRWFRGWLVVLFHLNYEPGRMTLMCPEFDWDPEQSLWLTCHLMHPHPDEWHHDSAYDSHWLRKGEMEVAMGRERYVPFG